MSSQAESARANVALVRESVEAFNAGDMAKLLAVAAPDIVIHYAEMPGPLQGRETWQQGYELVKRAFPDLKIRVDDLVAAGDKVALRLTLSGTHLGEFQGIPATGRTISYVSHEFYRVANGVFAEEWICSDTLPTTELTQHPHGEEWVDGSNPSEGSTKLLSRVCLVLALATRSHRVAPQRLLVARPSSEEAVHLGSIPPSRLGSE